MSVKQKAGTKRFHYKRKNELDRPKQEFGKVEPIENLILKSAQEALDLNQDDEIEEEFFNGEYR